MANAADERGKTATFWTTLPGILTGVAALLTAVTGLTLGLYQYGVLGSKQREADNPATPSAAAQETTEGIAAGRASPANPVSDNSAPVTRQAMVEITASDGTITTVFAHSFGQIAQYDEQLHLLSGQAIAFANIKSIDVVRVYSERADARITLVDDRVIEGVLGAGSSIYELSGENDLGTFSIKVEHLKRVVFRR